MDRQSWWGWTLGAVASSTDSIDLDGVLSSRAVFPVFQPVVDLATGRPVAYEALARGPEDSALRTPDQLFAAARREGRLADLDRLCRSRALEAALEHELPARVGLFVNVEPDALFDDLPVDLLLAVGARGITVTVEFTERSLLADPARLIAYAERLRARGLGVALDDVGAVPASVALMPLLRPDIVKLDMRLVQQRPDTEVAEVMTAVTAYAEESGARVVAEGIETEDHEFVALSLGARWGQGWRYGRPGALPSGPAGPSVSLDIAVGTGGPRHLPPAPAHGSPFDLATRQVPARRATKPLLAAVSRLLETQAGALRGLAVVLSTFEDAEHFGPRQARSYTALAEHSALVVVFGAGLSTTPAPGVRGADIVDGDPLRTEWDVVVVGPHFTAALLARERPDEPGFGFDYVLTYDRQVVLEIARLLMARVVPLPVPERTNGSPAPH